MTAKQDAFYWREWGAVRKAMPEADRHELHVRALGLDKSHKEFTELEFDRVLAVFRAISKPDDLSAQLRQLAQAKTRFIYAIRKAAPEAYIAHLLQERFSWKMWLRKHYPDFAWLTKIKKKDERVSLSELRSILIAEFDASEHFAPALDDLNEGELQQLRNTVAARQNSLRKRTKQPTARELAVARGVEVPF